MVRQMD